MDKSDTPVVGRIEFSSVFNPTTWAVNGDKPLVFTTQDDAKRAEELFAALQRDLAAAEAVIAQVDVDDLVYQGRILERYEDPRLNPLSEQNFRSYDSARRKIWIVDRVIRAYREGK